MNTNMFTIYTFMVDNDKEEKSQKMTAIKKMRKRGGGKEVREKREIDST